LGDFEAAQKGKAENWEPGPGRYHQYSDPHIITKRLIEEGRIVSFAQNR
jgi:hypothetical protein